MTHINDMLRFSHARRTLPAVALLLTVAAAPGPARADDWGTPGLDSSHARLSAERSGALFADDRWTVASTRGTRTLASPVVADGYVVTADLGGTVQALRADTGKAIWQRKIGASLQGTPALARGRVYVPTLANTVVAVRLADGAVLWTHDLGGMVLASPTPIDGDVLIASGFPQRRLERVSGATGLTIWQSPPVMNQFSNTSPAIGGGLAVVGSNGGHYYAFDLETGLMKWEYVGDGVVHLATPLIVGDRVYVAGGGDSSHVHAIDLASGAPIAGWPVALPLPEADIPGTRKARQRAVSSLVSAGGLLVLQTRLDDAMDSNADGAIDKTLSREWVVGLDAVTGAIAWEHALARAEITDPNDIPKFFACPTPAAYGLAGGRVAMAAASSLDAAVVVLDAGSGQELALHAVAGPALASPVMANGRLITVAMNGTVQGLASSVNHAPAAPAPVESDLALDAGDVTLRWMPALDLDGESASYELRIDSDGELLETWKAQEFVRAGVTSTLVSMPLTPGVTYSFAVRARDAAGALSPWSRAATFRTTTNPAVTVGGVVARSLGAAVAAARAGDVIRLAAGAYTLPETLRVPAGVLVQGAGAGQTILDGTGLATAVSFGGADAERGTRLDGMTVKGADRCVAVTDGATGVRLTHVIVRDCASTGVAVESGGDAEIVNATVVGNGTGISGRGTTQVRNSILCSNRVGLESGAPGTVLSTYNDFFDNHEDYAGLSRGSGDLAKSVTFSDLPGRNLRLTAPQPSTDSGDPTDPVGDEPAPNGGRINLGAFGGTAEAETSAPSSPATARTASAVPLTDPASVAQTGPDEATGVGCNVSNDPGKDWTSILLAVAVALLLRGLRARASRKPGA